MSLLQKHKRSTTRHILAILGYGVWLVLLAAFYTDFMVHADAECEAMRAISLAPCYYSDLYFTGFLLLFVGVGFYLFFRKRRMRTLALALYGFVLLYLAQGQSLAQLSDPRAFGFEMFYATFHFWTALYLGLLGVGLCAPYYSARVVKAALWLTALFSMLFVLIGRGSVDHLTYVLGGLMTGFSVSRLWLSELVQLWASTLMLGVVLVVCTLMYRWVKTGVVDTDFWHASRKFVLRMWALSFIILLSVPLGMMVNRYDVNQSKHFIEGLIVELESEWKENNQYPADIVPKILPEDADEPRLLKIFNYLAFNTKGAYFFSRQHKFCFLIFNPGYPFGYHSITSRRGWEFHPFDGLPLELLHNEYCDEPRTFKDRITEHMGVKTDPKTGRVTQPDAIFRQQWKTPDVADFPEFRATDQDLEKIMKGVEETMTGGKSK